MFFHDMNHAFCAKAMPLFFRNTVGISANALAKKVGLDPTTIYKIEANDSKPSLGSLENIWNYSHKEIGNPTGAQNNQKVGGREGDYL